MYNTHPAYGTYFGDLVTYEQALELTGENFTYVNFHHNETRDLVETLQILGVEEILFDLEGGEDRADVVFFKTGDKTLYRELMVYICGERPDEFSQESPNHFRMWFD
jgi:hypothetical protein